MKLPSSITLVFNFYTPSFATKVIQVAKVRKTLEISNHEVFFCSAEKEATVNHLQECFCLTERKIWILR